MSNYSYQRITLRSDLLEDQLNIKCAKGRYTRVHTIFPPFNNQCGEYMYEVILETKHQDE